MIPTSLNSTPGVPVSTTLTITNVGNVAYDAAISPTLPSGWTISGEDTPVSLAIGGSTTETVTITPPASAPLNSKQDVTLTYGPGVTQNTVSVIGVTPNPSTVEAGTSLDVSASVLAGVTQAEQGTVSYTVTNCQGTVVFTSTPVPIALPEVTGVTSVDLGNARHHGLQPRHLHDQCQRRAIPAASPSPGRPARGNCSSLRRSRPRQSLDRRNDTLTPGSGTVTEHAFHRRPGTIGPGRHGQPGGQRGD